LYLASIPSFAQSTHTVDNSLDECLAKTENQTTAGMTNCTALAADNWDKELNRAYKKLMAGLDAEEKQNLKNSQLEWLKHRDLEYKLIGSVYAHKEGTMYIPVRAMNILTLTKNRALELNSYL
jgi:uncharacterized protein YecT (DUF1311 family)